MLLPANACLIKIGCVNMDFKAGDLVKLRPDSWWINRSATFRKMVGSGLIMVTNGLPNSDKFFYGFVCGGDGEEHLWSCDQFEMVSKAS
jgi:hypothetical protein